MSSLCLAQGEELVGLWLGCHSLVSVPQVEFSCSRLNGDSLTHDQYIVGGRLRCLRKDLHSCETCERRCQEDEERCMGGSGQHASLVAYGSILGGGILHHERRKVPSYREGRCLITMPERNAFQPFHSKNNK